MKTISGINLEKFNCASKEIEALTDLWLEAAKAFINYYSSIPEDLLSKKIDNEGETAISVAGHVLACAAGHVKWSLELAGLTGPDKELIKSAQKVSNRKEILEMAEKLMEIIPQCLSPMTNDHLSNQGTTLWGEHMSSEGMIEHTIVHIYRHIRQLKVRL